MKTIYRLLLDNLDEDSFTLSEDFFLPKEHPEEKIGFADGAKDGIIFYHMGSSADAESEGFRYIREAIDEAAHQDYDQAFRLVSTFAGNGSTLSYIDLIQNYVIDNRDRLNPDYIHRFALMLILEGTQIEAVKVGMTLMELFDTYENEKLRNIVRLFGLSDEFSIYAGFLMTHWPNADEELFSMAQKVSGWGRIHAIRMLHNTTSEMEDWLVLHGVENGVISAYSALDVYQKIDYLKRISKPDLTLQYYRGLANLLDGLLDEGPVAGISLIDNSNEIVAEFIRASLARSDLEAVDLRVLLAVQEYLKANKTEFTNETVMLEQFLLSDRARKLVESAVLDGKHFDLARKLGVSYQEKVIELFKEDPLRYAYEMSLLLNVNDKPEEIISLIECNIDIDSIATGPADEMGLGKEFAVHQAVAYVLQGLRNHVNCGVKIVAAALNSPVINNRNLALSVLEEWIKQEQRPLLQMNPQLANCLEQVIRVEVREDIREKTLKILEDKGSMDI